MVNGTAEHYDYDYTAMENSYREDELAVALPIVIGLIVVLGLIGNGCVIGAVVRYKAMRSAPNMFIVNLAIGDILLNLVSMPTAGLIFTVPGWVYGAAMCKIGYFLKTLSLGLSIFTLTALSIDRVLVISQSLRFWQNPSTRITVMIGAVWLISIILATPDAIGYHLIHYEDEDRYYCDPHPLEWDRFHYAKIHSMAQMVLFFFIPLIIITVCYGTMAYVMVKNSHGIPGEACESSSWRIKQISTRRKVANIMIALIALFFVCWLPRAIVVLYSNYGKGNQLYTVTIHYVKIVATCLMFFNGCVNPIALYFLSKSFKTHFKKQLCCIRGKTLTSETDLATIPDSQAMIALANRRLSHKGNGMEHTERTEQTDILVEDRLC